MNLEKHLIAGLLAKDEIPSEDRVKLLNAVNYEFSPHSQTVLDFIFAHQVTYNSLPQVGTVKEKFPNYDLEYGNEPYIFYLEKAVEFKKTRHIQKSLLSVEKLISEGKINQALMEYSLAARDFESMDVRSHDIDFRQEVGSYVTAYKETRENGTPHGIYTGLSMIDNSTFGAMPGDFWVLAGRPGSYKCVSENSMVRNLSGERMTLREFLNRGETSIHSYDEKTGKMVISKVLKSVDTGLKDSFQVTTSSGKTVIVSDIHPFLTCDGWKPIKEISLGERIALPTILPFEDANAVSFPNDDAYMLGTLYANGCTVYGTTSISTGDKEVVDWLNMYSKSKNLKLNYKGNYDYTITGDKGNRDNHVRKLIVDFELLGKKSHMKELHPAIFTWTKEAKGWLLKGLFDGDGHVTNTGDIVYTTSSEELAKDLETLLLEFGIFTSFAKRKERHYNINIHGEFAVRFSQVIPKLIERRSSKMRKNILGSNYVLELPDTVLELLVDISKRVSSTKLAETLQLKSRKSLKLSRLVRKERGITRPLLSRLVSAYKELEILTKEEEDRFSYYLNREIIMDKVISIIKLPPVQMIDLEIEGTHNFIVDNVLVHNTFIMCFIYAFIGKMNEGNILFFSKEMTKQQIQSRVSAIIAGVSFKALRRYQLTDYQLHLLEENTKKLKGNLIIIGRDTRSDYDIPFVRSKIIEYSPIISFVDGLYLFSKGTEWGDQTNATRSIREIALSTNSPIIGTTQFNRSKGKKDQDNIAYSDSFLQDASVLIGMERVYDEVLEKVTSTVKITTLKVRDDEDQMSMVVRPNFENCTLEETAMPANSSDDDIISGALE